MFIHLHGGGGSSGKGSERGGGSGGRSSATTNPSAVVTNGFSLNIRYIKSNVRLKINDEKDYSYI